MPPLKRHDYARLTALRRTMPTWQVARETGQRPVIVRNVIRRIEATGVVFPTYPNKPMERVSRKGLTMNTHFTADERRGIREHYRQTGSIEATAQAKGLSYRVIQREVADLIDRPTRHDPADVQAILAAYEERPNINLISRHLKKPYSLVAEVVEKAHGSDRWKGGSQLRQKHQVARPAQEETMGPRVALESLDRSTPDALCRHYLGERYEHRHGGYWLDGRHCPSINIRMQAVNRVRRERGEEQLPVPEWRV